MDGTRFPTDFARDRLNDYAIRRSLTEDYSLLGVFPERAREAIKQSCDAERISLLVSTGLRYNLWHGEGDHGLEQMYFSFWRTLKDNQPIHWSLICLAGQSKQYRRIEWKWLLLSEDEMRMHFGHVPDLVQCRVSLVDKTGKELVSNVLKLRAGASVYNNTLWLAPFFVQILNQDWYTAEIRFRRAIAVAEEDVAALGEVRSTLERVRQEGK